jgi:hypothetical protein
MPIIISNIIVETFLDIGDKCFDVKDVRKENRAGIVAMLTKATGSRWILSERTLT